nr:hypothetical protein BaRGS_026343 [Batillaria attramentaria]
MATTTTSYSQTRHRNLSGPSGSCTTNRPPLDNRVLATPPPGVPGNNGYSYNSTSPRDNHHHLHQNGVTSGSSSSSNSANTSNGQHRKLDRSLSDSEHDRINGNHGGGSGRGVNSARYKTELCRPFEESGHCKYGDKCQFAHGAHELRNLARHPKYKTERCRTYHTIGFCPYGPRCHFIHNEDERIVAKPPPSQRILPAPSSAALPQRPNNLCGLNSLGSSFESVSPPSSSTSSPGNLSPSFVPDDMLPSVAFSPTSSSSSPSHSQDSSFSASPRSSPVFNFPASDASGVASLLTPLNIQTQQFYNNVVDMAAMQFSAILNFSQNQRNNCSISANLNVAANMGRATKGAQELESSGLPEPWSGEASDVGLPVPLPPASPVSLSDDSMGSTGSLDSSTSSFSTVNMCNSPLDLGKSLRLPIFNKLSEL